MKIVEAEISEKQYEDLLIWKNLQWSSKTMMNKDDFVRLMKKPIKYHLKASPKFFKYFKRLGGSFNQATFFPRIQMAFNAIARGADSELSSSYSHHKIVQDNTQNIHIGGDPSIGYSYPDSEGVITLNYFLDHASRGH